MKGSDLLTIFAGNLVIDLYTKRAPKESKNFIKLCKAKYYNFAPFYNVQKDFIVELGDPLYPIRQEGCSAWGLADPPGGKSFETTKNKLPQNKLGAVSFITQPSITAPYANYATSLFTITLKDIEDKNFFKNGVVFGQVAEGFEILETINSAYLDDDHRPLQDIRIHHAYILEDPFDDIEGLVIPPRSPQPSVEQLATVKLDDTEYIDLDDREELTEEQLKEKESRDADSKALTLEIIGDLPSAEVKPMENVLFVCKLNPLTRDDDLEIIFSRFGKIISCEVMKSKDTGESLQYAFIEYEEKKSCEAAYFKMDGVLIDDRRIHVDFSQSVSRLSDAWRKETNEKRQNSSETLRSNTGQNYRHSNRDSSYWRNNDNKNYSSHSKYRHGAERSPGGINREYSPKHRGKPPTSESHRDYSRRDERYYDRRREDRYRDDRYREDRYKARERQR